MSVTKYGKTIRKGQIFRLTREVTGENNEGIAGVVYGSTDELIVVTGRYINSNALEVITLIIPTHPDISFYSPFMVTLDDIDSVEEISPEESAYASELLEDYSKYLLEYKNELYEELENEISYSFDPTTKESILNFLDRFVELKGGAYTFGYFEEDDVNNE